MRRSIYNAAQWRWIADRYEEGYPLSVIASAISLGEEAVVYHLKKMGVPVTPPRRRPGLPLPERMHELHALADAVDAEEFKNVANRLTESEAARADLGRRLAAISQQYAAAQKELDAARLEICRRCIVMPCRRDGCRWWRGKETK